MKSSNPGVINARRYYGSDGKLACNAEITFRVVEFPNQEFRQHMEKAAAALAFPMESPAND